MPIPTTPGKHYHFITVVFENLYFHFLLLQFVFVCNISVTFFTCTFENIALTDPNPCGLTPYFSTQGFWQLHRGPTITEGTGPDVDDTTATALGNSMTLVNYQLYFPAIFSHPLQITQYRKLIKSIFV